MDGANDTGVDREPIGVTKLAAFSVVLGGALFLAIGLVTALMAYADAEEVEGFSTTDRLLVATRPLTLSAVGLLCIAAGVTLAILDRRETRSHQTSPQLAALRGQHDGG